MGQAYGSFIIFSFYFPRLKPGATRLIEPTVLPLHNFIRSPFWQMRSIDLCGSPRFREILIRGKRKCLKVLRTVGSAHIASIRYIIRWQMRSIDPFCSNGFQPVEMRTDKGLENRRFGSY